MLLSTHDSTSIQIKNFKRKCSKTKKLLGIKIDKKLRFNCYVGTVFQKPNRILDALARKTKYRLPLCNRLGSRRRLQKKVNPRYWISEKTRHQISVKIRPQKDWTPMTDYQRYQTPSVKQMLNEKQIRFFQSQSPIIGTKLFATFLKHEAKNLLTLLDNFNYYKQL